MQRIGQPRSISEPAGTRCRFQLDIRTAVGCMMGTGAIVCAGNDEDRTCLHRQPLNHPGSGHNTGNFVSMRAAQNQHASTGLFSLQYIYGRVSGRIAQYRQIIGKPTQLRNTVSRANIMVAHLCSGAAGY